MILDLLLATIATGTPVTVPVPRTMPPAVVASDTRPRLRCRAEFGVTSLVQRYRVCHTAADWRVIDARHRSRRGPGA